jgi:hypothetical protein
MIGMLSFACAVCFGDPDSLMAKAISPAVLFMMAIVFFVLSVIGGTAFVWARRAKDLEKHGQ